jgi:hypothetical protein
VSTQPPTGLKAAVGVTTNIFIVKKRLSNPVLILYRNENHISCLPKGIIGIGIGFRRMILTVNFTLL